MIARPTGGFAQESSSRPARTTGWRSTPGRHRGRVPRPRDAGLLALGQGDAAHRRAARGLRARRQVGAAGIVKHGRASASTLIFDRVPKKLKVSVGDTIVTAGWRSNKLASLYPRGIPIGRVTSVGQADTDLWKQVQVEPFADFDRVDAVLVLVRKDAQP